ncbi:MAG TPA: hypothetical protein VK335_35365 [Bryobacteraceae bacterium]|nr:hypothetical protein [Bryobacteraceae bacterium]
MTMSLADLSTIGERLDEISGKLGESAEKKKELSGKLAVFSALGTFILYFFGYLTLRFHLTAFGISTDLAVLDERYLFAGAQFLVYLVATIPTMILLASVPALFLFALRRTWWSTFQKLADRPNQLLLVAVIFSTLWIQFVVRQCFNFSNLLLARTLPDPWWMAHWILLDSDGSSQQIYFALLLGACLATLGLWWLARQREGARWSLGTVLVAALVVIQFLFMPVTFGVLIANKEAPQVTSLDGKDPLPPGRKAWRIWEGKEGVVFLAASADLKSAPEQRRTLITIDKKEIKKTEIVGYDRILSVLFEADQ